MTARTKSLAVDLGFMAVLLALCVVAWALGSGCKSSLSNNGEVSFFYGTQIGFKHNAAKTSDEPATAELSSQPLLDYLADDDAATGTETPPVTP